MLQPARAIPRKNVPAALAVRRGARRRSSHRRRVRVLAHRPGGGRLRAGARRAARRRAGAGSTLGLGPGPADAYAAADVVVFPSTVEGFGNPVIESVIARRPLVVGHYPVLDEILAHGFELFRVDEPEARSRSGSPTRTRRCSTATSRVPGAHYALDDLPARIDAAFRDHGWTTW